jgi:hypothetical protein
MAKFDETEFKQHLSNVDPSDIDTHADIYGVFVYFLFLTQFRDPQYLVYFRDHADMSKQPPLYLLIYAINTILYPNFLIEQTPDILNLLGQVELLRRRAVKNCVNVLQLNAIYREEARKQDGTSFILLSKEDEDLLKYFSGRSATDREIFIVLIHWICLYVSCSVNRRFTILLLLLLLLMDLCSIFAIC